jgi:hypothetical protein
MDHCSFVTDRCASTMSLSRAGASDASRAFGALATCVARRNEGLSDASDLKGESAM